MKKALIAILFIQLATNLPAQIKIDDQPGEEYYELVKKTCSGKIPSKKDLLALKPLAVSASILDTLKKYDWYMIGGYSYGGDNEYHNYFAQEHFANEKESQFQFHFFRVLPDGTVADFSIHKFKTDPSNVTTTSFSKSNCTTYKAIKVVKGISFIEGVIFGSSEFTKIAYYKDGLLIIDINISGKVTDPKVRFRNVYCAVPKKFNWDFK